MRRILIFPFLLLTFVSACEPQHSTEYVQLTRHERSEWVDFARRIPLERRIILYDEVYRSRGHPPETILAQAFEGGGGVAFEAVLNRIESSKDFIRYLPILYALDRDPDFDICEDKHQAQIQQATKSLRFSDHERREIRFAGCTPLHPAAG